MKMAAVCKQVHWESSAMVSMTAGTDRMRCTAVSFEDVKSFVILLLSICYSSLTLEKKVS